MPLIVESSTLGNCDTMPALALPARIGDHRVAVAKGR